MPNVGFYTMHTVLGWRLKSVRNSASEAGGKLSWDFSQITNPVKKTICSYSHTAGGICQMLSTCWIEHHAKGGHLANWISKPGSKGEIDPSKIRLIGQYQAMGELMNTGAMFGSPQNGTQNQDQASINYLAKKGIGRRKQILPFHLTHGGHANPVVGSESSRGGAAKASFAKELGMNIAGNGTNTSYKLIGISGSRFGHCMAAWAGADVAFFDPNWGEFWFQNKALFASWFPKFWHKAGYDIPMVGLSDIYTVLEFVG